MAVSSSWWLHSLKNWSLLDFRGDSNKDYYRQRVTYLVLQEFFRPIRFGLKNQGGVGARDIHIQLKFKGAQGKIILLTKGQLPSSAPSPTSSGYGLLSETYPNSPNELLSAGGEIWDATIDIAALQPQRELSPSTEFLIGAFDGEEILLTATIFADTLSEPIEQTLKIKLEVQKVTVSANDVISKIIKPETRPD